MNIFSLSKHEKRQLLFRGYCNWNVNEVSYFCSSQETRLKYSEKEIQQSIEAEHYDEDDSIYESDFYDSESFKKIKLSFR